MMLVGDQVDAKTMKNTMTLTKKFQQRRPTMTDAQTASALDKLATGEILQTSEKSQIRTLKAAYADGWRDRRPSDYGGESLTLKGHDLIRGASTAITANQWRAERRRPKEGEMPCVRGPDERARPSPPPSRQTTPHPVTDCSPIPCAISAKLDTKKER